MQPHTINISRNDEGEKLFPGPEWFRLDDCRNGQLAVPGGQEHDQGHHVLFGDENVSLGHLAHGGQRVLYDTHDGLIGLRGDDLK